MGRCCAKMYSPPVRSRTSGHVRTMRTSKLVPGAFRSKFWLRFLATSRDAKCPAPLMRRSWRTPYLVWSCCFAWGRYTMMSWIHDIDRRHLNSSETVVMKEPVNGDTPTGTGPTAHNTFQCCPGDPNKKGFRLLCHLTVRHSSATSFSFREIVLSLIPNDTSEHCDFQQSFTHDKGRRLAAWLRFLEIQGSVYNPYLHSIRMTIQFSCHRSLRNISTTYARTGEFSCEVAGRGEYTPFMKNRSKDAFGSSLFQNCQE